MHGGVLHLTMNMLAFASLGPSLERQHGSVTFGYLMLLFMIFGDVVYVFGSYILSGCVQSILASE